MKDKRTQKHMWVKLGAKVEVCFGELVGTLEEHRDWGNYPCMYCGYPIKVRDWWWYLPWSFYPPAHKEGTELGLCSECVALFSVRPREVPRDQWLEEMFERGASEVFPDLPLPEVRA